MLCAFRNRVERVFSPLSKAAYKAGIGPNIITTLGLFSALLTGYMIITGSQYTVIVLLMTLFFDMFDGMVAKTNKSFTKFGDFYDAFTDRLVEAIIYLSLLSTGHQLAVAALVLSYLVSYIAARAEVWTIGKRIRYVSIGSRAERMILLLAGFVLAQIDYSLILICLISAVGIVHRVVVVKGALRQNK